MASLIERYHQWRRRTFPASKEDVAWRHDFLTFLTRSAGAKIDSVDRKLNEIEGSLNVTPNHTRLTFLQLLRRRARTLIDGGQRMNYYSSESPDGVGYLAAIRRGMSVRHSFWGIFGVERHWRKIYFSLRDWGPSLRWSPENWAEGNPNYVLAVTASPKSTPTTSI